MEKLEMNMAARRLQNVIKKYWYVPTLLLIVTGLFLAGSWHGQKKAAAQKAAGGRRILYYVDPMNPAHTAPEPGLAPCGMKLEPVYAEDGDQAAGAAMPPGSVKISPEKQQIIGVRVATTEKSPYTYTLRTVGKVAVDETRIFRLNAYVEGWVLKIFNNTTGSLVRKDEPLATFFNRDLPTTLQTYYFALDAMDRMAHDPNVLSSQQDLVVAQKLTSEGFLMNLGMGKPQLDDLSRSRKLTQEIVISAPATSFILARNVTPGQRFSPGDELYRLADLSRVWIVADLFENEAKYVRAGEKVRVTLPSQGEPRQATVSEILPEFDPATLTLKVRLEMGNPKFTLRPGMFVDVEFPINLPPSINVPVDAIMDSGLKQIVFVDRGNGYFEPRRVKIGWRLGDRVEIVEGLKPGDRIVVSGNFLIDSESRMKLAAAGFFGNVVKDPVCDMNLDEDKAKAAGRKSDYQGKAYYFCSDECQKKFDKMPTHYGIKPEAGPAPEGVVSGPQAPAAPEKASGKTKDPVCGMNLDESKAKSAGLKSDYQGKTYYFCSDECQKKFDKMPTHYGIKPEAGPAPEGVVSLPQTPEATEMAKDPVCGHEVNKDRAQAAGLISNYKGKVYYFCSCTCNKQFDKNPEHYLAKTPAEAGHGAAGPHGAHLATGMVKDPVCGLEVAQEAAQKAGRTSQYQGKTYYFDTDGCKQRFDINPQRYLSGSGGASPVVIQPYPDVPLESDTLLRYKRTILRTRPQAPAPAASPGPTAPMPHGATPAAPAGPAQPMVHGATPAMPAGPSAPLPQGATPATPGKPAQPMAHPGAVPGVSPVMPHGGAQAAPPAATPGSTPIAPQVQPAPPAPQTIQPQPPHATPSPLQPVTPTSPPGHEGHQHD
jgi:membrane fusion protein, copper/silver efflux system